LVKVNCMNAIAIGALVFSAAIPLDAKPKKGSIKAEVRTSADLCTKIAGSGKARMTELARGGNVFMARLEMDPGAKVPEHRDATEEYIHILQGKGTIYIDGKAHQVAPGTTVFMPANAKVSFENGPESLVGIQVFSGPGPASKYDGWEGCN
jgi:quercetin dioxygenase-like cupin family protein